jgi:hypothetical protein
MNQKIFEHVKAFNINHKWVEGITEEHVIETIRDSATVATCDIYNRRWWAEHTRIVEIDGMFIGFRDAYTTGDESAADKGYAFNPDTIREYKPVPVTVIQYVSCE